MYCQFCGRFVSDTSKFCRYCGKQIFLAFDSRPSAPRAPGGVASPSRRSSKTEITMKLMPEFYPIPKKYEAQLRAGTRPEAIIGELLRQRAEMRNLLEEVARAGHGGAADNSAQAATKFLASHCLACGDVMEDNESGQVPICPDCREAGGR